MATSGVHTPRLNATMARAAITPPCGYSRPTPSPPPSLHRLAVVLLLLYMAAAAWLLRRESYTAARPEIRDDSTHLSGNFVDNHWLPGVNTLRRYAIFYLCANRGGSMRALAAVAFAGTLAACAAENNWPPSAGMQQPAATNVAATATFPYCPRSETSIGRRRIDDGVTLTTMTYRQVGQAPPCVVSFGGTVRYFDVFGARSWPDSDVQRLARTLSSLFPLAVGKTASLSLTAEADRAEGSHVWAFSFEVLRQERIQVPAGSYDTFVVRISQRGQFNNVYHEESAVWLTADRYIPIRVTRRLLRGVEGPSPVRDWEAVNFSAAR